MDEGYADCVEPAPVVHSIEVVTAQWSPLYLQSNTDPATVVDILPIYLDYTRANQLLVRGRWLTAPVSVTVGARSCYNPQVRNVSSHCWPSADAGEVCRSYGESIMCTLMDDLGVSQKVIVVTGRGSRRRTISSLALSDGPRGETSLTLSAMEPVIASLHLPRGPAGDLCQQPDSVTLTECPNTEAFLVLICVSGVSLSGRYTDDHSFEPTRTQSEPAVLADTTPLACADWRYDYSESTPCGLEVYWCIKTEVCSSCLVEPVQGRSLTLSIVYNITETESISNAKQNSLRATAATISFAGCPNGTWTNYSAHYTERCVACRPGESTMGLQEQQRCTPCRPGYHAKEPGSADCTACEAGTHSASPGQPSCEPCTGNAWQLYSAQSHCSKCEQGKYKVLGQSAAHSSNNLSTLPCEACPTGAQCREDGTIIAGPGSFLILNAQTGLVSAVDCLWTACVAGNAACLERRQTAQWSGISVANCCGDNRMPAIDEAGAINPLCAQCLDGYTEMQGQCVECRATRWDRLLGVLALLFLLVYLLHRLSQRSSSAQLPIFFYAAQMSLLFLASEPVPYVFGLLSIDLLGNPSSSSSTDLLPSACFLPIGDYGKMELRLLSPVVALLLLGLLCLTQLACRALLRRRGESPSLTLAYRLLFSSRTLPTPPPYGVGAAAPLELSAVSPSLAKALLCEEEKREADGDGPEVKYSRSIEPPITPTEEAQADADAVAEGPTLSVKEDWRSVLLAYESTAVRLLMFSYNVVATVCLAFFHTHAVEGFGQRLWSYPAIVTSSAAYVGLVPLMGFLLLSVVFGAPVALLGYLLWLRRTGRIALEVSGSSSSVDGSGQQPSDDGEAVLVPAAVTATALPGALLTAPFRPRFWFMSVLTVGRRLALILCITFAAQPAAYTLLTLLNCAILVVHALTWPYRMERDNWMETVALSVLVVQTGLLSLYPAFMSRPMAASAALWGLLLLPGAMMLLVLLRDVLRYLRGRRDR